MLTPEPEGRKLGLGVLTQSGRVQGGLPSFGGRVAILSVMRTEPSLRAASARGPLNICWHCGYVNPHGCEFCRECAYPLSETEAPEPRDFRTSLAETAPGPRRARMTAAETALETASETASDRPALAGVPEPAAPPPPLPSVAPVPTEAVDDAGGEADAGGRAPRHERAAALALLVGLVVVVGVLVLVALSSGGRRRAASVGSVPSAVRSSAAVGGNDAVRGSAAVGAAGHRFSAIPGAHTAPAVRQAAAGVAARGPDASVGTYWRRINDHQYAAAYREVAPGLLPLTAAAFISYEQSIGVESASFRGAVGAIAGGLATVHVKSLITRDERFGCQTWSGSYQMVSEQGQWLIRRANIRAVPCR